jgi:hypothetical protein
MWSSIACEALRKGRRLELHYDGFTRVVEVHAVGVAKDGHPLMRVFQVRGGSRGGEPIGWKLMRIDEAIAVNLLDEPSEAPRAGYADHDPALVIVDCAVKPAAAHASHETAGA